MKNTCVAKTITMMACGALYALALAACSKPADTNQTTTPAPQAPTPATTEVTPAVAVAAAVTESVATTETATAETAIEAATNDAPAAIEAATNDAPAAIEAATNDAPAAIEAATDDEPVAAVVAEGAPSVVEEEEQEPSVRITIPVKDRKDSNLPLIEAGHGSKDTPVMVPWAPMTNRYVMFEVKVEDAASYKFSVTYADQGNKRKADIYVNESMVASNYVFEATGGYDLAFQRKRVVCRMILTNGLNYIRISGQDNSLPIMSAVTIEK